MSTPTKSSEKLPDLKHLPLPVRKVVRALVRAKLDRLAALKAKQESTEQRGQAVTLKAVPDCERDAYKPSEGHVLGMVETKPRYLVLIRGKTSKDTKAQ